MPDKDIRLDKLLTDYRARAIRTISNNCMTTASVRSDVIHEKKARNAIHHHVASLLLAERQRCADLARQIALEDGGTTSVAAHVAAAIEVMSHDPA